MPDPVRFYLLIIFFFSHGIAIESEDVAPAKIIKMIYKNQLLEDQLKIKYVIPFENKIALASPLNPHYHFVFPILILIYEKLNRYYTN
jgi:hypothetical protein